MHKEDKKRAQVTLFIIIALFLVVAIIGIFIVIRNNVGTGDISTPSSAVGLDDYVSNCLEQTLSEGIVLVGRQGGYYTPDLSGVSYIDFSGSDSEPEPLTTELPSIKVAYHIYDRENKVPSKEEIEKQISNYVVDKLNLCVQIENYEDRGWNVVQEPITANTTIKENETSVRVVWPLTLSKDDALLEAKYFNAKVSVRLGRVYDITNALNVVQSAFANYTGNLCLSCFMDYKNNDFYTQILIAEDNSLLFVITDLKKELEGEYYDFIFAGRYP